MCNCATAAEYGPVREVKKWRTGIRMESVATMYSARFSAVVAFQLSVGSILALNTLSGCSSGADNSAKVRKASSQAITELSSCDRNTLLSGASSARQAVLQRGFTWFDAQVPYSQTSYHDGYRTDCSGFVSMCWQLGTSYTTANFYSGSAQDTLLNSYSDLLPGDAVVYRSGDEGHIVLFAGWLDSSQTNMCVIEEECTNCGTVFQTRSAADLQGGGYIPVRANSLMGDNNAGASTGAPSGAPSATTDQCSSAGYILCSDGATCGMADGQPCQPGTACCSGVCDGTSGVCAPSTVAGGTSGGVAGCIVDGNACTPGNDGQCCGFQQGGISSCQQDFFGNSTCQPVTSN